MKDIDKYRGCLIGGAAGDALGYAIEFLDEESIFQRYGELGITEYDLVDGVAQISDDTQMTLFTANALLLGTTRGMTRGIMGPYSSYVGLCYKDWLRTQTEKYPVDNKNSYTYTWLINIPEYPIDCTGQHLPICNSRRSWNNEKPINKAKMRGNESVGGLYLEHGKRSDEELDRIMREVAAITLVTNLVISLQQHLPTSFGVSPIGCEHG